MKYYKLFFYGRQSINICRAQKSVEMRMLNSKNTQSLKDDFNNIWKLFAQATVPITISTFTWIGKP